MKTTKITLALVFATILAAFAVSATTAIPLKGSYTGTGSNFSGNLTHLGLFQGTVTSATTETFVAANGDKIFVTVTSFTTGATATNGDTPYTETFTVTGGTGRFVNESGSATVTGVIHSNGSYTGNVDGSVAK